MIIKRFFIYAFLSVFTVLSFTSVTIAEEVPRKVLRIFNSEDQLSIIDNELDRGLEMVINQLGLKMDYFDISKGLPSDELMNDYYGIIIWLFDHEFEGAVKFWSWQKDQLNLNKKIVLLQQPRPGLIRETGEEANMNIINEVLELMDFKIGLTYSDYAPEIDIVYKDSSIVEFERELDNELPQFYESYSLSDENEVFLKLQIKNTNISSDTVMTSKKGGIVMGDFVYYMDPYVYKKQWRINPFKFLSKALDIDDHPRFDYSTANGRRIFYSHIDGDGLNNSTTAIKNNGELTCGDVVYEKVLKAYPYTPITTSFITAEIDPKYEGSKRSLQLARNIFKLQNIEPASHTFTHPLIWNTDSARKGDFEKYSKIVSKKIENKALTVYKFKDYVYSPKAEITDSIAYLNEHVVPENKKCELLLWSGNCIPTKRELDEVKRAGVLNMNGGDGRLDQLHPSYLYMAPAYRKVGDHYQIYTSNANDNLYIKGEDPLTNGSFQSMISTFKLSESPKRVAPINIYYHFFSGSTKAGTQALINLYDWALEQDIHPMYASDYIKTVHGFLSGKLYKIGKDHWRVSNNKACKTLRFDFDNKHVDMSQSKNVLGYKHYQGSTYVAIGNQEISEIKLISQPKNQRYLYEASSQINDLTGLNTNNISYDTFFFGKSEFIWHNFPANQQVEITIIQKEKANKLIKTRTTDKGVLQYETTEFGEASMKVSLL